MDIERLKKAAKESCDKIEKSNCFVAIYSDNYTNDPVCLMQLALAILLDRPMFLLFPKGFAPPKNLIRILDGYVCIEGDDETSIARAAVKLKEKIGRHFLKSWQKGEK